jgi:excisionase family DNA binding protein
MEGEYIDIRELSTWLKIKLPTAYKMAESGQIPSYKLGKLRRFKVSEIQEWMESCRA